MGMETHGRKRIVLLGSTGSIGRSTLDVVRAYPERFEVVGLGAHSNAEALAAQVAEFSPAYAGLSDERAGRRLAEEAGAGVTVWAGPGSMERLADLPVDVVLCAMVGAVGLHPLLRAIDAGNRVAVANKEPFVMAGRLIMERARARGVDVLPVDSEHNAIFQCIHGHEHAHVACVHLTASGGPFLWPRTGFAAGSKAGGGCESSDVEHGCENQCGFGDLNEQGPGNH